MTETTSQSAVKRYDVWLSKAMECQEDKKMHNRIFAEFCGVSHTTWKCLRINTTKCSAFTMLKISEATGIQI